MSDNQCKLVLVSVSERLVSVCEYKGVLVSIREC